jgi:hydrogenase nickel incorporation protein HypB
MTTRVLELRQGVLSKNGELARELRDRFTAAGTFVANLVSSPGSGKTAFLERTLDGLLRRGRSAAALVGDLETDHDARRLARSGAAVRQITTHGCCHLDAAMVSRHLEDWDLRAIDFLFIENVGNLVCPANYDLGEHLRIVMMSVTEGEDKPLKYPTIFHTADLAVITKADLAAPCEFDGRAARANIAAVRPGVPILEVSSKSGAGFDAWLAFLERGAGGEDVPGSAR